MPEITIGQILQKIADTNKVIDTLKKLKHDVKYISFDIEAIISQLETEKITLVTEYDNITDDYIEEAEFVAKAFENIN